MDVKDIRVDAVVSLSFWDMDTTLWSGARDRWKDAPFSQREQVWERVVEYMTGGIDMPTLTEINDLIWFECDDIFFPEEEEEEEEEEEDDDDE